MSTAMKVLNVARTFSLVLILVGSANWLTTGIAMTADTMAPPPYDLVHYIFPSGDYRKILQMVIYYLVGVAGVFWSASYALPQIFPTVEFV